MKIVIKSIPHSHHRYSGTVGDYFTDKKGIEQVCVSEMSDWRYEYLVAMHELIEDFLCQHRGIKESDITEFDIEFEKYREERIQNQRDMQGKHASAWYRRNKSTQAVIDEINSEEPGDDKMACYHKEHVFATKIEKMLAEELQIDWAKYSKEIENL